MSKLLELRRKRAATIQTMQHLMDGADGEGRGLTEQEEADFESFQAEVESLDGEIERRTRLDALRAGLTDPAEGGQRRRQNPGDGNLGMGERDLRDYSIVRAIRASAAARRGERNAWAGAELELEASQAVSQRMGAEPQGFYVPDDVAYRDLNVGTDTAGGHLVATELAGSMIELLRNRLVVRAAGATVLTGLVGDLAIPRQTGGATSYWVAESGAPTESQQAVDQVALAPKTLGAFTDYSRKLALQSSFSVEQFVRGDLALVQALAIDLAALHGTGASNQPTGVAATSGIGSVVGGTNGANPDLADIIDLETAVAIDNADLGSLAYITNAVVRGFLKQTPRVASTDSKMIWAEGNTPLNGYASHVTNQVSSALTKGTASGVCSAIFFGNWADLIIGMWGGLDILVDPYTHSTSGTMRVVALQDVDIAVRHPQSFAAMLDALTS